MGDGEAHRQDPGDGTVPVTVPLAAVTDATGNITGDTTDDTGRRYPLRPLIGVGVVVFRDDQVLLIRRGKPPRAGEWSIPGGLQRLGETVFAAAVREVAEETGVAITLLGVAAVVDLIERDALDAVRFHYTLIDVAAEWAAGDAVADSDAAAVAWVALDALPAEEMWVETKRIISEATRLRRCRPHEA